MAEALAKEIVAEAGADHCFYICGPSAWMNEMQAELLNLGARKVMCEVFGSQLATGCPFAASAPQEQLATGCPFAASAPQVA